MEEFDLTAEGASGHLRLYFWLNYPLLDAVAQVAAVRSVTCPAEFFVHQLELYEICNCNPDPATSPEYRRFLMNYMAQDMLGECGDLSIIRKLTSQSACTRRRRRRQPHPRILPYSRTQSTQISRSTRSLLSNDHPRRRHTAVTPNLTTWQQQLCDITRCSVRDHISCPSGFKHQRRVERFTGHVKHDSSTAYVRGRASRRPLQPDGTSSFVS